MACYIPSFFFVELHERVYLVYFQVNLQHLLSYFLFFHYYLVSRQAAIATPALVSLFYRPLFLVTLYSLGTN